MYQLRSGKVYGLIGLLVLQQLFGGNLSGRNGRQRLFKLHGMPRRIVLCFYWPDCSDRRLRCGLLLGYIFNCLFELLRWYVFCEFWKQIL